MAPIPEYPPPTRIELSGWELVWARLVPSNEGDDGAAEGAWPAAHERLLSRFAGEPLTGDATVRAVRRLFKEAGCDPSRYRPSSEALARRVLRGDELPRIHPWVDLNNLLSLELLVPCCVIDPRGVEPPFVLRRGGDDERMASMRGDIALAGKPVLADVQGAFGTPITDSERVKVGAGCAEAWMVAYLPAEPGDGTARVSRALARLLEALPVAVPAELRVATVVPS